MIAAAAANGDILTLDRLAAFGAAAGSRGVCWREHCEPVMTEVLTCAAKKNCVAVLQWMEAQSEACGLQAEEFWESCNRALGGLIYAAVCSGRTGALEWLAALCATAAWRARRFQQALLYDMTLLLSAACCNETAVVLQWLAAQSAAAGRTALDFWLDCDLDIEYGLYNLANFGVEFHDYVEGMFMASGGSQAEHARASVVNIGGALCNLVNSGDLSRLNRARSVNALAGRTDEQLWNDCKMFPLHEALDQTNLSVLEWFAKLCAAGPENFVHVCCRRLVAAPIGCHMLEPDKIAWATEWLVECMGAQESDFVAVGAGRIWLAWWQRKGMACRLAVLVAVSRRQRGRGHWLPAELWDWCAAEVGA
jgi:hypothetical protein